ncbi:TetR/AcrR family transcriptional regulator [Flavobacterium pectinovorum]|uniref:TetR/AcrR family transcriptional regulator n=1 Tax=Flavobacterium pectinovorum TaxID=29533 RepID=UPI001FAD8E05|nr:TetR/AcrR family transcriptional regulator [Flavobacterium pectinovorum]MCI9845782.1 TetR/AcrR family transcriptional regulator [Flavobacterium pectinovorum]
MEKKTNQVSKAQKREEMIKSAYAIFYKNGFHATGVDTIVDSTGISKRTLYKHFTSKEGLILAAVNYYHQIMYGAIADYIEKPVLDNPVDKALMIFDFLSELVDAGNLYGCFAMNAKTEYAHKAAEIELACDVHTNALKGLIEKYLVEAEIKESESLAIQIIMLFEGAILRSKGTESSLPIQLAKSAAKVLCNQY